MTGGWRDAAEHHEIDAERTRLLKFSRVVAGSGTPRHRRPTHTRHQCRRTQMDPIGPARHGNVLGRIDQNPRVEAMRDRHNITRQTHELGFGEIFFTQLDKTQSRRQCRFEFMHERIATDLPGAAEAVDGR